MTPYYKDKWATIYLGDCREVLPGIPKAQNAVAFADPEYNVALGSEKHSRRQRGYVGSDDARSEDDYQACITQWAALIRAHAETALITPGNGNMHRWPAPLWTMAWIKRNGCTRTPLTRGRKMTHSAWEPILVYGRLDCPPKHDTLMIPISRQGAAEGHPCPKPLRLLKALLAMTEETRLVIDPFLGSGTTCLAAKELGRKSIGIEIEEKYCEIAANRLSQGVLW